MSKKPFFLLIFCLILATGTSHAAPLLTLEECLETALANNPKLTVSESAIESNQAAVEQIKSENRFQINAGTSYTRSGNFDSSEGSYSTGINVEKSLFDWGKRDLRTKAALLDEDVSRLNLRAVREDVISDVKGAYYSLNRHVRERETARAKLDNYEKRLDWAKSYYEVGTKAKIEVTKAESDYASARLSLVQAESKIEQSKAELAAAMGTPMLEIGEVKDELDYDGWDIELDAALARAESDRPEIAVRKIKEEYARTFLELQHKGLSPNVSASAGYNFGGSSFFEDDGWRAKLSMTVPIYDGGLTKSKIKSAEAELKSASAETQNTLNAVRLEVRKAWQSHREAKESLSASLLSEKYAKETLELAQGRYRAGVADSLEISDAVNGYAAASVNTTAALYKCKEARLALERAMGGLEK